MTETGVDPAAHWVGPAAHPDTYVLKETIGRGSEGEVWRAELPLSTEGRATVAVKTMFRPPGDEAWEKQGRLLTTLSHPGLVRVTSMFIGPAWHLAGAANANSRVGYVVMDFVEGMTLREWCGENPDARVGERIRKLRTVAAALDHMHSGGQTVQGVAHGDVKPSNIVVRGDGTTVLVDLGLARLTDATGIAGRTAPYAAPELRVADPIPTPEADRFAFVVTMAEVLLGQPVPRIERLGWVDEAALEEALNRNPRTATRPALIKHILDALAAAPEDRCRPGTVAGYTATSGGTIDGAQPDAVPVTRSDWLSAWLDSATETLSHITSTSGGFQAVPAPVGPAAVVPAPAVPDTTSLSEPRGVPVGGWTAPPATGPQGAVPAPAPPPGNPPYPDPYGATGYRMPPAPPAGRPRRRRGRVVAVLAAVLVLVVAAAVLANQLVGGGSGKPNAAASTPVSQQTTAPSGSPSAQTSAAATSTATLTSTPTSSPAGATDWGTLTGNPITVNKMLAPCAGCPDPILVEITTIQTIKANNEMIWGVHLSAPTATQQNGYTEASFPEFAVQSVTTPSCPASVSNINNSPIDFQANFTCLPVNGQMYTLSVTVSYHTISGGTVSIQDSQISFEPATMVFDA